MHWCVGACTCVWTHTRASMQPCLLIVHMPQSSTGGISLAIFACARLSCCHSQCTSNTAGTFARSQARTWVCMQVSHALTVMHARMRARTLARVHTHVRMHAHRCTHTHACAHARNHVCTHTRTHTLAWIPARQLCKPADGCAFERCRREASTTQRPSHTATSACVRACVRACMCAPVLSCPVPSRPVPSRPVHACVRSRSVPSL